MINETISFGYDKLPARIFLFFIIHPANARV